MSPIRLRSPVPDHRLYNGQGTRDLRAGERLSLELSWLPLREDWEGELREARTLPPVDVVPALRRLASSRMDFLQLTQLDRVFRRAADASRFQLPGLQTVRLAVLGSSTTGHLLPGIRLAGLRRGLLFDIYESPFGMYRQELFDSNSGLASFRPEAVLLALDARHLTSAVAVSDEGDAGPEAALSALRSCWRRAGESFRCHVLQQTAMPVFPALLGNNEERLPDSPSAMVALLNERLRATALAEGVDLLALDRLVVEHGLAAWHEPGLWHHAKQEVHPRAAEMYGEHVARLVAAGQGRSAKCLVLDLDNTLWGGVIGDDGLEGIVLGQGSATGEAFLEFQRYVKALAARGVVLAVSSKNEEGNARAPFESHPEMLLRCSDIACFVANWQDKAANLRAIARQLNLCLDALVFVDDNPVERALVRRVLPEVHVPELPAEPAEYAATLSAAGYFEGLRTTKEDLARATHYRANSAREALRESATDLTGYLESLRMTLTAAPIDSLSLTRATQLINKTNQFNLTTRRRTEAEVAAIMSDPGYITLQARLKDRFGDNGIIAVIVARVQGRQAVIENWLMSCRVLGRRVEEACLNVLVEMTEAHGVQDLVGEYIPSEKNSLVREMYAGLGFLPVQTSAPGTTRWELSLGEFQPVEVPVAIKALLPVSAR